MTELNSKYFTFYSNEKLIQDYYKLIKANLLLNVSKTSNYDLSHRILLGHWREEIYEVIIVKAKFISGHASSFTVKKNYIDSAVYKFPRCTQTGILLLLYRDIISDEGLCQWANCR